MKASSESCLVYGGDSSNLLKYSEFGAKNLERLVMSLLFPASK